MLRTVALLCASFLAASSCKSEKKPAGEPADTTASETDAPAPAGTDPQPPVALAITLWPGNWDGVVAAVRTLAEKTPELQAGLDGDVLGSPWVAMTPLLRIVDLPPLTAPPNGFARDGAITLELLLAPAPFEAVAAALAGRRKIEEPTWPRVRATLDAADPGALAAAVADMATRGSLDQVVAGELYRTDELALRITRLDATVVVEIVGGLDVGPLDAGALAKLFGAAATPARPAFELGRPSALRIALYADHLGDLGATTAMAKVAGAIAMIEDDDLSAHLAPGVEGAGYRSALLAQGTKEVMSGYLFMDPKTTVAARAMIEVPASPDQSPQVGLLLSAAGSSALEAAGLEADKATPFADVDWRKAAAAAPLSPLLQKTSDARQLSQVFHECGWSCWAYLGVGNALPMARVLLQSGELEKMLGELPPQATAAQNAIAMTRKKDLVVLHARGASADAWTAAAKGPDAGGDAACYRDALVKVHAALGRVASSDPSQRPLAVQEATAALDGAKPCAAANPAVEDRYEALTRFLSALETELGKKATGGP